MGPLKDGARIATYTPPSDEPDEVVNLDFTFLEGLQFARNTYMLTSEVLSTLRSIHSCIREGILPPLARYLPEPEWFNSTVQ